jgi:5-methylcytosine-specific restriction endonuclease McrA
MGEWAAAKEEVLPLFVLRQGNWYLADESVIKLSRDIGRNPIPALSKMAAKERGFRCSYCGDEDGPFDHDHLFPISQGGTDEPNNIVMACYRCNRSKGGKSLLEWMAYLRSKNV